MKKSILVVGVLLLLGVAGSILFVKARAKTQRDGCLNNLMQIDSASDSWAMEQNKSRGAEIDLKEISMYLKGNLPICLSGGEYTVPTLGLSPSCSIHGALWEGQSTGGHKFENWEHQQNPAR